MYAFRIMNKNAGIETHILSFTRNLAIKPRSISTDSPADEISMTGFSISPTTNPMAPTNSKTTVSNPYFSRLKRLNSLFM